MGVTYIEEYEHETTGLGTTPVNVDSLTESGGESPPQQGWLVRVQVSVSGPANSVSVVVREDATAAYQYVESLTFDVSGQPFAAASMRSWYSLSDPTAFGYSVVTDDGTNMTDVTVTLTIEMAERDVVRHETMPWDAVKVRWHAPHKQTQDLDDVSLLVERISDGKYLQTDDSWDTTPDYLSVPVTGGRFDWDMPTASMTRIAGREGYYVWFVSASGAPNGALRISTTESPWEAALTEYRDAGTFGEGAFLALALRQKNSLWVPDTWSAAGQATHGYVHVYETKSALDADSSPYSGAYASYEVTLTYDGSNRLTNYEAKDA